MANPFLFMEEESDSMTAPSDAFSNPFLVEDDDEEAVDFGADNPFSASNPFAFNDTEDDSNVPTSAADLFPSDTVTQSGANLFLVDDDDDEQQVDATMSFFGTTINEYDGLQYHKPSDLNVNQHELIDDSINAYSSEDELKGKKPQRPNPPSQVTQQLITNLADHLDQTSNNLLGKLPVTRTPSPVSMRDLHSPSPTPDVGDLLDVSEAFGDVQEEQNNSFVAQPVIQNHQEAEHKPNRPPPPRPVPPRPTPPKGSLKSSPVTAPTPIYPVNTATVTQAQQPQQDDEDMFNFFGTEQKKKPPPKPPAPKSKEDILSLFTPQPPSQPVQQTQKPDLLSEDIDFTVQTQVHTQAPVAIVQPYEPNQEIIEEPAAIPQAIVEPIMHQPVENHVMSMQNIPRIDVDLTPDLPPDEDDYPIEETAQPKSEFSSDQSPESGITSSGIPESASGSIFNMQMQEPEVIQETPFVQETPFIQETFHEVEEVNPFAVANPLTPPEQLQQLQFLQQKSTEYQYQRPTTPDPIVAQPELAPIFGGPLPTSPAKPAPPRPPARGGSVLTTVQPSPVAAVVPEIFRSDEFDDFSAKFESKTQPKVTGNAFLDSLGTDAVPADAWGDADAFGGTAVSADDGFGNDEEGFDTWDPPVVPESTPYMNRRGSSGSNEGKDFSVVIKPKQVDFDYGNAAPILGPPPPQRSPYSGSIYSEGKAICFNGDCGRLNYFYLQIHRRE